MNETRLPDDDPLWTPIPRADRSPDPSDPSDPAADATPAHELAELERLLGRFAHDGRGFDHERLRRSVSTESIATNSHRPRRAVVTIAASLLVTASLLAWWFGSRPSSPTPQRGWLVDGTRALQVGEKFATGKGNATLELGAIAKLELSSGSLIQLRAADDARAHFYLERGRLHAKVTASVLPRFFQVETPAVRCVDLGCEYHLSVDSTGHTHVRVVDGQIAFELPDAKGTVRDVFVPKGAVCSATPENGLGTPHFATTEDSIAKLIVAFDATSVGEPGRADLAGKLAAMIVAGGERRDSLSLWHLLQDEDVAVVELAERALLELVGPPFPSKQVAAFELATWRAHLEPLWR